MTPNKTGLNNSLLPLEDPFFATLVQEIKQSSKINNIGHLIAFFGSARINNKHTDYLAAEHIAQKIGECGFNTITGGGPGIMEAANKGAWSSQAKSIGLNISLKHEQKPNEWQDISLTFEHFFARKLMFVHYTSAFIVFPGGLGTLDELTEIMLLMQTDKIRQRPIILFNVNHWQDFTIWLNEHLKQQGLMSQSDLNLLHTTDSPAECIDIITKHNYQV